MLARADFTKALRGFDPRTLHAHPELAASVRQRLADLAHAPGASEEGFHRTLMQMLEAWESEGHTVLNSRTLEPSTPEGQPDELGGVLAHPWPQWEEHSRCSRLLYFSE